MAAFSLVLSRLIRGQYMVIIGVLACFIVLIVLGSAGAAKGRRKSGSVSYVRRSLMTSREREFFVLLRAALPVEVEIYAQVSMGALVDVARGARWERNRFDRKVMDFVVCAVGGAVLYVIELDDRSHAGESAQRRDAVKNDICAAAGLPLVRYRSVRTEASTLRADFERFAGVAASVSVGAVWPVLRCDV